MIGPSAARPPSPRLATFDESRPARPSTSRRLGRFRPIGIVAFVLIALVAAAGPARAVSGVAWPTQSLGDRGSDVLAIQRLLRARIAADPPTDPPAVLPPADSVFGPATVAAVRAFQQSRGIAVTGIVESVTWGRLIVGLREGATGEAVTALQMLLVEKRRAAIVVDGAFGAITAYAVRSLQKHMGLTVNGIVGTGTWRALAWHFELPRFSSSQLCDYSVGNGAANWGTAMAIATTELAGRAMVGLGYGRVAVGDVSFEHGGDIPGHMSHERGLDVDLRPMRKANDQCAWGTRWTFSSYDRTATRALIKRIRALAPGHIKVIYFNDPTLIREGLTRWYSGHDDHIHVRFCEKTHPVAIHDC